MALQEIGSDLPKACPTAPLVDYDFSAPFSPLEGITGQASVQPRPRWGPVVLPDMIQNHSFHISSEEKIPQIQETVTKTSLLAGASQSSSLGLHTPEESEKSSVCAQPSQASAQQVDESGSNTGNEHKESTPILQQDAETGILESKPEDRQSKDDVVNKALSTTTVQGDQGDHKVLTSLSDDGGVEPQETGAKEQSSDTHNKDGKNIPLPDFHRPLSSPHSDVSQTSPTIHGHSSDAHIKIGQYVSEVTAALPSQNIHGHASDSHIKIGGHVSEVDAPVPSPNVHGHASDAHVKIGENVSEFVAPLPTPNVHGHVSDAHIKVGELIPDVVSPLPSPSVHGHSSDAHIQVGENVSEIVVPLPAPSIHGHSSDANIKVGEFVSNVPEAKPRWSKHGHASDSTLQPGCLVSGAEPSLSPLPGSSYGHSSDSALGVGCVVSGDEPKRSPLPGSAHGHSSDSNLGVGCVVSQSEPLPSPLPGSSYGHSSDSTLGIGCVVLGTEPQPAPLPGSTFGHSSDSSLGVGCVVKDKETGNQQKVKGNEYNKGTKQSLCYTHTHSVVTFM